MPKPDDDASTAPPSSTPKPRKGMTRPLSRFPQPDPARSTPPSIVERKVSVAEDPGVEAVPFTIDRGDLQKSVRAIAQDLTELLKKGRYTKVRIKLGKRQILPELPVAVALAAGGLTAALVGPLQAILGTMVGQTVLNVELISDAATYVTRGRELILAGELEQAIAQYQIALAINRDHAPAYLALGVALKLKGDRPAARGAFERASALDPKGSTGLDAEKLLATLRG